jgi:hypothetical protein
MCGYSWIKAIVFITFRFADIEIGDIPG